MGGCGGSTLPAGARVGGCGGGWPPSVFPYPVLLAAAPPPRHPVLASDCVACCTETFIQVGGCGLGEPVPWWEGAPRLPAGSKGEWRAGTGQQRPCPGLEPVARVHCGPEQTSWPECFLLGKVLRFFLVLHTRESCLSVGPHRGFILTEESSQAPDALHQGLLSCWCGRPLTEGGHPAAPRSGKGLPGGAESKARPFLGLP